MSKETRALPVRATGLASVPVAPGRLPVLGHALSLWRHPLEFLRGLSSAGDLVRIDIGTLPVCCVTRADLVHDLLVTKARSFEKGRFFDRLRPLAGDGLATASAEVHRSHRGLVRPSFHHDRIADYTAIMSRRTAALTESWRPGQTVVLDEEFCSLVGAIMAEAMFSAPLGRQAELAVRRDGPVIFDNLLVRTLLPRFLDRVPVPANRRFNAASRRMRTVIDEVIRAYRADGRDHGDLLSALMLARDADTGRALDDLEIRDELVTILIGGIEGTAATLAWIFHELGRLPEAARRVREEAREVARSGLIRHQDLGRLEYTGRVVDEALRLKGVPFLMRRAVEPVEIDGVRLPAGTEVGFSLHALHRDPRLFPDPERFDPDRWLPERRHSRPRHAFMPFGAGSRKCVGDVFARTEMITVAATVLARWDVRPVPGHSVREVTSAVIRPNRLPVTVEPA
ncbi:cytochrome P450 [Streptomyces sp. NPDC059396]|uniref:cytochrome P450 n=1 Tax=Streptomyces sp. NPDC059396 TaxID=3346819 RepID=UPI0036D02100